MNQKLGSNWQQKAGIVAILGTVLIFQLGSIYAQSGRMQDAGIYASPGLNVEISTSNSSGVDSGEAIFYEISYANLGVDEATEVFLNISVPPYTTFDADFSSAGWDCGGSAVAGTECSFSLETLAPGVSSAENLLFVVRVDQPLPAGVTQIDAEVSIVDDGLNGPSEGSQQVDSISVPILNPQPTPTPTPIPSLIVEISTNDVNIQAGSLITYEISYANPTADEATGVEVHMAVPEHTTFVVDGSSEGWDCGDSVAAGTGCVFPIGKLAAGDSSDEDLSYVVRVDQFLPACDQPNYVAQIEAQVSIVDDGLNGPSTGSLIDDREVVPISGPCPAPTVEPTPTPVPTSLIVEISATDLFYPGLPSITYKISYANPTVDDATGVEVHMIVPEHTTFGADRSSEGWDCGGSIAAGTECVFQIGTLAAGDSRDEELSFFVLRDRDLQFCDRLSPDHQAQIDAEVSIVDDGLNGPI